MQLPAAQRRATPILLLVLAAVCWGTASALSKIALEQLTAIDLFGAETVIGAIGIGAIVALSGTRLDRRRVPRSWFVLGLLEPGLAFLLFDLGLDQTSATHAAFLLATDALATVALAGLFLGERPGSALWAALAAAIVGSIVISAQPGGHASVAGDLLVVTAAVAAGAYSVLARGTTPGGDPILVTAVQMVGALSIAVPFSIASVAGGHSRLPHADARHVAVLVAVALLGTVIPFVLFTIAIGRLSATFSGIILGLVPVFGVVAAIVLLGERIGPLQSAGGVLVLAGATIAVRSE